MSEAFDFSGRTIVVTGGTKGIGRSITERFLASGANVVICARNEPETPVSAGDGTATFVGCDVREPDQVQTVIDTAVDAHGGVDVLINNAGGAPPADSSTASARFNERIIALNLLAPITFSQAANQVMQTQTGGGSIINISSVSGMRANPQGVAYGAAKAGLINASQTLAVEWAPKVRVNSLTSGLVLTPDARAFYGDDDSVAKVAATIPLGRLGQPSDIADACLVLASPLTTWVTGSNFVVHGGGDIPPYLSASDAL